MTRLDGLINFVYFFGVCFLTYIIYSLVKMYFLRFNKFNLSLEQQKFILKLISIIGIGCSLSWIPFFRDNLMIFYIMISLTYLLANFLRIFFDHFEHTLSNTINVTQIRFLKHLCIGLAYFLGILLAVSSIPPFTSIAFSLLASSGVVVAIIGLASQQVFSNILSGVFLQIFVPFTIGDKIKIKEVMGEVTDINLRHTTLITKENNIVVVPNNIINNEIVETINQSTE